MFLRDNRVWVNKHGVPVLSLFSLFLTQMTFFEGKNVKLHQVSVAVAGMGI
jgi:hypothetical protein